ncbi:PKD domain-containing protein [Desulfobulbus sp.]|uniref:PKD domain-containing protein n=1 Tax=Desulfobulbus sp. TaxID=895 RepID=UPI0027B9F530|nr:PKD domain-containing protein [Desulfobulbus sp.]
MQLTLIRLLVAFCCWLPFFASAATQSVHVEWGYTPPSEPAVTGFKLYQEGVFACQVEDPNATAMDCEVTLTAATTNFTLTARFSDSTESPHSAPFAFTTTDATVPDTTPKTPAPDPDTDTATTESGSKLFTFSWGSTADQTTLKGYKIYLNDVPLCETSTPSATSLACKADLIRGVMTFGMTQVAADGSESAVSNLLVFDPTAYPELFTTKLVTFNWEYSGTTDITGFRVYQNNALICQTTDPTARQLACTVDINSTPVSYGLTAVQSDGSESILSNLLTYTSDSSTTEPTDTTTLKAVITAAPLTGTAPVTVDFNGTSSTGSISSFQWDFGDGATATGNTASHAYTNAGAYTTKLTITDAAGQTSIASATVTITEPATPATPPTAVISSSGAAGPAPLTVNFDGSGSTAASGAAITSYAWSFGDGSSATGTGTSHSFTSAGTYDTTLTITDSKGLTSSTSTPVVVTAAIITNKAPTAVTSAAPITGTIPLTVTFDGSPSTDSDGTIASYTWNFGDGSSASGKTVTHTYSTAATFTATLQVADDKGATGSAVTTITAQPKEQETSQLNMETGEISVTDKWVRVPLTGTFQNPIVIAGPVGFNNADPGVVRLRNVDKTGFDIKFAEWNYLDGTHPEETLSYLVVEKGRFTLDDGSSVEAGSFAGTTSFKTISFSTAFAKTPVMLTTIASANEADTISGRIKNIGLSSFAYYFREQEKNTNTHANETVNFIAWEPGTGSIGSVQFEVGTTAKAVTNAWYSRTYQTSFTQPPLLLADMQTTANTDTSALRVQLLTATEFQVKVEEEKSKDTEITHPVETVGYLALNQAEEKVLATFAWDFDAAQEANITGFQVLANGEQICTTNAATARQLSCEITKPATAKAFTIQSIEKTGGLSSPSNTVIYTP